MPVETVELVCPQYRDAVRLLCYEGGSGTICDGELYRCLDRECREKRLEGWILCPFKPKTCEDLDECYVELK